MKTLHQFLIIFCLTFGLSGCYVDLDLDDDLPCLQGSGNVISEERTVSNFDKIHVYGNADVYITQGNIRQIEVFAEDNLMRRVITNVSGGTLEVDIQGCITQSRTALVYITTPDIRSISVSGSAYITSESQIQGNKLEVIMSGSGDMDLWVETRELTVRNTGSGNIVMSGITDFQDVYLTGSGDYEGLDLYSDISEALISGSGDAYLYARNTLDATITGSGNIYYKGEPFEVRTRITGSGNVIKY